MNDYIPFVVVILPIVIEIRLGIHQADMGRQLVDMRQQVFGVALVREVLPKPVGRQPVVSLDRQLDGETLGEGVTMRLHEGVERLKLWNGDMSVLPVLSIGEIVAFIAQFQSHCHVGRQCAEIEIGLIDKQVFQKGGEIRLCLFGTASIARDVFKHWHVARGRDNQGEIESPPGGVIEYVA
jgi:hypothetical protein